MEIPIAIHEQLMMLFKEYIVIGGMPQAVASWVHERSLKAINKIHNDLIATYRDDFAKYGGRLDPERLDEVMRAVPLQLGEKFVYSKVNSSTQAGTVKQSLDLLCKARVCNRVVSSSANGVPLGAELHDKFFKVNFLDVGLCSAALNLSLDKLNVIKEIDLINKGGIAEQVAGQILRTIVPPYIEPTLYYWHRVEKGSNAEVDYVIQHHNTVVPLEVKAGSTGRLKSLHLFMSLKRYKHAIRVNSELPLKTDVNVKDYQGNPTKYTLISIPFYLLGEIDRLLP